MRGACSPKTGKARARRPAPTAGRRRGFTLVEILVVMAIMVILFGLLFAPMVSGLQLVQRGKRHVTMQDAARLALEQIKRELADAVYVFPPDIIHVASMDGNPANINVVDYSTLTYVLPQRLANGELATPVQPAMIDSDGDGVPDAFQAVRLAVHLVHIGDAHGEENPFALFRETGYVTRDAANPDRWVWAGVVLSENALTPRSGVDIPPTLSICETCGSAWSGYAAKCLNPSCPDYNTDNAMRYIFQGVQFVPERICGEVLRKSGDGTLYRAKWGGWLGTQNDGTQAYPPGPLPLSQSELDPQIVVYRYNSGTGQWTDVVLHTLDPAYPPAPGLKMRWNSSAGAVRFGEWYSNGPVFAVNHDPGVTHFYPLTIGTDSYDNTGSLTSGGSYTQDIYPVYPPAPSQPGDPRAPIAYVIEPTRGGSAPPAKIIANMVSVRLLVRYTTGEFRYYDLRRTLNYDQDSIGKWEFCAFASPDQRTVQVRFNRSNPPSPDWFGGAGALRGFAIQIRYYARHNFDPTTNKDDIVRADYSTNRIINIRLVLNSFINLEPTSANPDVYTVPPDMHVHQMQARDQVVIRNAL